jgi:thiosulfate/3-mercaptopyruvate sulfurtransferase
LSVLVLSPEQARQIEKEGVAAFPNECCGVMIGRDIVAGGQTRRLVDRLEPLANDFETGERFHRFSIRPQDLIAAEKSAGKDGKLVLGFYHSHPNAPARPSEYDRVHAWPFYSYLIVSIAGPDPKPLDMTSWDLDEETATFQRQDVIEAADSMDPTTARTTMTSTYSNPETLVSTDWVAEHTNDPNVKIIEVDVDTTSYEKGHARNAIGWNWQTDLNDRVRRDVIDARQFAELCRAAGIRASDTVVLYGDNNNWFAAWALWQFKYHGHKDVRLMNGGRKKWELEKRPLVSDVPTPTRSDYPIPSSDESVRAYRDDVMGTLNRNTINLVDVRSPDEYTGKVIAPPGMTETAQRGGHIPGARSIPWAKTANEDGTFKSPDELRKLYVDAGVDFSKPTIAYCRIGERSSHTWFVLKYLLGVANVRNYDGSWTEWGNLVGAPIETGSGPTAMPNVKC